MPSAGTSRLGDGAHVNLVTEEEPGEMLVGEYTKQGRSNIITFNTNTCQPGRANDRFAAVAMLVRLFQWLNTRIHITPISCSYAQRSSARPFMRDVVEGFGEWWLVSLRRYGHADALAIASTFLGNQTLDLAFR